MLFTCIQSNSYIKTAKHRLGLVRGVHPCNIPATVGLAATVAGGQKRGFMAPPQTHTHQAHPRLRAEQPRLKTVHAMGIAEGNSCETQLGCCKITYAIVIPM